MAASSWVLSREYGACGASTLAVETSAEGVQGLRQSPPRYDARRSFAELARLETKMDAEFAGLQAEMSAFLSRVTDELGKTRGAIVEKLANVQASLTAIRDDIAVDIGGVDPKHATTSSHPILAVDVLRRLLFERAIAPIEHTAPFGCRRCRSAPSCC